MAAPPVPANEPDEADCDPAAAAGELLVEEELLIEEISIDGMCGVYWTVPAAPLELSPQVALRPEPFGALAYHYGNRRLTFLRSPELVALVRSLGGHPSAAEALRASGIEAERWPGYERALASLLASDVLRERGADAD